GLRGLQIFFGKAMRECRLFFFYNGGHREKKGENKVVSIFLPFFLCALCVKIFALKKLTA
ncbi:MAG TPA: hypothetical protein PLI47_12635, partial [Bacteroidia bacterium]|nr:hypothetical protein [Bacteroidia bacterium]